MILWEEISVTYGATRVLGPLSLGVEDGEWLGLIGPNGAGKTTTVNIAVGLLSPDGGTIEVDGGSPTAPAVRAKIGVAPQTLALYDELTGEENIAFFGRLQGLTGKKRAERVRWSLDFVGLNDRRGDRMKTYSGGMKRRLNLAVAVVHDPPLLLLDEPTVGVDPQSRQRLFEMVEAERDTGACVLYTTHYMEEAERLCDSLAIIDHGKIIANGTVSELKAQLGARDILQLNGEFPGELGATVAGRGIGDLEVISEDEGVLTVTMTAASQHLPTIFEAVTAAGGTVKETSLRSPNLETLFLLLTGKELRE